MKVELLAPAGNFSKLKTAFYFGAAVIVTILAVEWLDSRLLWDAHESGNARFDD